MGPHSTFPNPSRPTKASPKTSSISWPPETRQAVILCGCCMGLFQGRDLGQWLVESGAFPSCQQVPPVERSPLDNQGVGFRWEMATQQARRSNFDLRLDFGILESQVERIGLFIDMQFQFCLSSCGQN